jgi:hypothetical protein
MDLLQLGSTWWWFIISVALLELAVLALVIYLGKLRRRRWRRGPGVVPGGAILNRDPKWVSLEIERLCTGRDLTEPIIKQMSPEDRALFEVSVIDALNNRSRESQHRLRSALIKYGYDEQCARRVMSEDISDRVRATALLTLLRPQWRDEPSDSDRRSSGDYSLRRVGVSRATGSLETD